MDLCNPWIALHFTFICYVLIRNPLRSRLTGFTTISITPAISIVEVCQIICKCTPTSFEASHADPVSRFAISRQLVLVHLVSTSSHRYSSGVLISIVQITINQITIKLVNASLHNAVPQPQFTTRCMYIYIDMQAPTCLVTWQVGNKMR